MYLPSLWGRDLSLRNGWQMVFTRYLGKAGPIAADEGVYVQLPKENSAAMKAGLRRGDVVLAVDRQEIDSLWNLQEAMENAASGEEIQLTVRRDSGVIEEVAIVRP